MLILKKSEIIEESEESEIVEIKDYSFYRVSDSESELKPANTNNVNKKRRRKRRSHKAVSKPNAVKRGNKKSNEQVPTSAFKRRHSQSSSATTKPEVQKNSFNLLANNENQDEDINYETADISKEICEKKIKQLRYSTNYSILK